MANTPLTFCFPNGGSIKLVKYGNMPANTVIKYGKRNNINSDANPDFTSFLNTTAPINVNSNQAVCLSSTGNNFSRNNLNYYKFVIQGDGVTVSGDLSSIVGANEAYYKQYSFYRAFQNCDTIVNASKLNLTLPITTLP